MRIVEAFKSVVHLTRNPKPKIAVYTIITGNYDNGPFHKPVPLPEVADHFLITDDPDAKYDEWTTVVTTIPDTVPDKKKHVWHQRFLKTCPHKIDALKAYDVIIYIDSSIKIKSPFTMLKEALDDPGIDIVHFQHPERKNCEQETKKVVDLGMCSSESLDRALQLYGDVDWSRQILSETSILIRRNNARVHEFGEKWISAMRHIGCHRDQSMFNFVLSKSDLKDLQIPQSVIIKEKNFREHRLSRFSPP